MDNHLKSVTCNSDAFLLIDYKANNVKERSYAIYKIQLDGTNNTDESWNYIMDIKDAESIHYRIPAALTKELTDSFIKNPKEGAKYAFNKWLSRYR